MLEPWTWWAIGKCTRHICCYLGSPNNAICELLEHEWNWGLQDLLTLVRFSCGQWPWEWREYITQPITKRKLSTPLYSPLPWDQGYNWPFLVNTILPPTQEIKLPVKQLNLDTNCKSIWKPEWPMSQTQNKSLSRKDSVEQEYGYKEKKEVTFY